MRNFYSDPKIKKTANYFKNYNKIKARNKQETVDIESMTFSPMEFTGRVMSSNISNPTEQIALLKTAKTEDEILLMILDYSIYVAASYALIKKRKKIIEALYSHLCDGIPASWLDQDPHTFYKYKRLALENAAFNLSVHNYI